MTTFSWLRALLDQQPPNRSKIKRQRTLRLGVEQLEERRVFVTRVWDGGAVTNDFWMDRFNWEDNIAPKAGDSLQFPDSIRFTDRALVNNFPEGTQFKNIIFNGGGYLIRGNGITLSGNFTYAPKIATLVGNSKINLNINFAAGDHDVKITPADPDKEEAIQFNGTLSDTGTGDITFTGPSRILFAGDNANTVDTHTMIFDNPGFVPEDANDRITFLDLDKPDNKRVFAGNVVIGHGVRAAVQFHGTLTSQERVGQINPNSAVTVTGGTLQIAKETLRDLTIAEDGFVLLVRQIDAANNNNDVEGVLTLGGVVNVGKDGGVITDTNGTPTINLGTQTTFVSGAGNLLDVRLPLHGGDFIKDGPGNVSLEPSPFPNAHGKTIVDAGGLFLSGFNDRITVPHDLFINGGTVFETQLNEQIADDATVTLNGGKLQLATASQETVKKISGSGSVVVRADAELTVTGDVALDTNSSLSVSDGATMFIQGNLGLDDSAAAVNQATLRFADLELAGSTLSAAGAAAKVTLAGNVGVAASATPSEIKGSLFLRAGEHAITVDDGAAVNDLIISAAINSEVGAFGATGTLTKSGPGRLVLSGTNAYSDTNLTAGVLEIDGVQTSGKVNVSGGFLIGKGDAREINATGGVVNPGINIGILTTSEKTFLGGGSKLKVQLNGVTVGTQFDQLKTNELQLGSPTAHPTLQVKRNFDPALGQKFRIVNVLGTSVLDADHIFQDVNGTALPEGASFLANGKNFTITYKGGNGNDVVITRNTPPAFENRAVTPEINEGGKVFVTGMITEDNPNDTFFLDVNWGDGTPLQTFTFPPGSPLNVKIGHRYLDDPAGTDDHYNVKLHWRDEFGGTNGAVLTTQVHNVAPSILALTGTVPPINAGSPFTLQGSISDASLKDAFKVYIQWTENGAWESIDLPAASTGFSLQHTYAQSGHYKISALIVDDDLGIDQDGIAIDVI